MSKQNYIFRIKKSKHFKIGQIMANLLLRSSSIVANFSKPLSSSIRTRSIHKTAYILQKSTKDERFCVVASPENLNPVVGLTIPEFLWSNLHKWENAPAFECGVLGRKYSHIEVYKKSRSFATALKQSGLKRNDVVALLLPNVPEYPIAILGILEQGIIASPFNPTYTAHEIATQINNCGAKVIITLPQFLPQVKEAQKQSPTLKSVIIIGEPQEGCHNFFEMLNVNSQGVQLSTGKDVDTLNDIAILPWSSGTTGPAKGVMLTHSNICTNILQITQPGMVATHFFENGNPQERFCGILPFFHIYGFVVVMAKCLYQGASTMTLPKFEPSVFLENLRRHRPTILHLVPPLINFIGTSPDVTQKDFESVRTVMGGAAPIGPASITKLFEKAGKELLFQEGYGMTEMSPVSHLLPQWTKNKKIGSCGVILPGSMSKIIDPDSGEALGPNKPGELCVKGPQVMKGYYKNEKATNETIDKDNWLHTGDIAMYDEDKLFYIVDRLKELIKVRGFQVAPSELEDLLRSHPDVLDVAVIGVPCERAGELPRAYIVPKNSNLSEDEINNFLNDKISAHKKLKGGVEFVKIIPKAASGKILRRVLKADYLSKHKK